VSEVTDAGTYITLGSATLVVGESTDATPNSAKTAFTLDKTFVVVMFVAISGVVQSASAYTLAGAILTFGTPPTTGSTILVRGMYDPT
jgi:hypothetical protein